MRILQNEAKREKASSSMRTWWPHWRSCQQAKGNPKLQLGATSEKNATGGPQRLWIFPIWLPVLFRHSRCRLMLSQTYRSVTTHPWPDQFCSAPAAIAITVKTARNILPNCRRSARRRPHRSGQGVHSQAQDSRYGEKGLNVEADLGLVDFGPLDVEIHLDQGLNISTPAVRSEAQPEVIARIVFAEPLRGVAGSEELAQDTSTYPANCGPEKRSELCSLCLRAHSGRRGSDQLSSDACRVVAGGADFPAVLTKFVTLPGLGGLQGLTLDEFDFLMRSQLQRARVEPSLELRIRVQRQLWSPRTQGQSLQD